MAATDSLSDYFGFDRHGTDLRTEVLAGLTTFLTMSYIVVVNPSILVGIEGEKPGIIVPGLSYGETVQAVAVVTIIAAFVATVIMALYANRPFAQAPGLGLNAFFAFTVVGAQASRGRRRSRPSSSRGSSSSSSRSPAPGGTSSRRSPNR